MWYDLLHRLRTYLLRYTFVYFFILFLSVCIFSFSLARSRGMEGGMRAGIELVILPNIYIELHCVL